MRHPEEFAEAKRLYQEHRTGQTMSITEAADAALRDAQRTLQVGETLTQSVLKLAHSGVSVEVQIIATVVKKPEGI